MSEPSARSISLLTIAFELTNDATFYDAVDSDYAAEAAALILRNVYMSDPQLVEDLTRRAVEMREEGAAPRIQKQLAAAITIIERS